ncbi:MAG: hypothetical protein JXQ73_20565, partial [Phycisphaerae bacterium]|nr:hypothetical protein [Phycisphaerae bacterium]
MKASGYGYRLGTGGVAILIVACGVQAAWAQSRVEVAKAEDSRGVELAGARIEQLEALLDAQQVKIQSLRDQIESLETQSTAAGRRAAVHKVVRELMEDSSFRESLYPDVQQVGYHKGFYIKSSDETFLLTVSAYTRWRWTGQNRQTDNPRLQGRQKQDDINGFEVEDLYFTFKGHIHTKDLTYRITTEGDTDISHDWRTYYAWINYRFADEVEFMAGLMKAPFGRQETLSKSALQFVDRSMANELFNLDRVILAGFHGTLAKRLSYTLAVANGIANRSDSPSREELDTNFAYMGRLVAHVLGKEIKGESDLAYSKDPQLEAGLSFVY